MFIWRNLDPKLMATLLLAAARAYQDGGGSAGAPRAAPGEAALRQPAPAPTSGEHRRD